MRKYKIIVFVVLIVLLIYILLLGIFGSSISFKSVKEIKKDRKSNPELITNLKINNIDAIYDKNSNTYYYMLEKDKENKNYVLNLQLDNGLKYKIIDETLNVVKVSYKKQYKIIIFNKKNYYETKIQLTNLPLVNITTESEITTSDTKTNFTYINRELINETSTNYALMHIRGATSTVFDKKSYKINFTNKNYSNEKDINISNFYYGDSLILDAVYRDPSKIRNVISTELWNSISDDFSNINIYNEFVEVFINNEYKGIYVLTEPVNKTKLNLSKSGLKDTSVVIKSNSWTTVTEILENYNINEDVYLNYELKYPNDDNLYEASWNSILKKLATYYTNPDSSNVITKTFNINNYIDMIIFNGFLNNGDNNMQKNNYFYMNSLDSSEVLIQPWDMEYVIGLNWDSNDEKFIRKDMSDYTKIYTKFQHKSNTINKLLIKRYKELRKTTLNKKYFDILLDNYIEKLNKGAALRDSNIWYEYDIEQETEEIRTWLYNRLDFFDNYIESLENE